MPEKKRSKYYVVFFHSSRSFEGHIFFIKKKVFSHRLHIPIIERNHDGTLDILISVHF